MQCCPGTCHEWGVGLVGPLVWCLLTATFGFQSPESISMQLCSVLCDPSAVSLQLALSWAGLDFSWGRMWHSVSAAHQLRMFGVIQPRRAVLHRPVWLKRNLNTQYIVVLSNKFLDASGQLLTLIFLP